MGGGGAENNKCSTIAHIGSQSEWEEESGGEAAPARFITTENGRWGSEDRWSNGMEVDRY